MIIDDRHCIIIFPRLNIIFPYAHNHSRIMELQADTEIDSHKLIIPTPQQLQWHSWNLGMFCHFGLNTFHDQEWGEGTDSPETFNPCALDARQWVWTAATAGFKYFILTAKHHDGFCLWPTSTTDYSVRSSPWKAGRGDVVREVANACTEFGLHLGLYLSPWDRHEPCWKDPTLYDDFYAKQLEELLTQYGTLGEVWFDGAGSTDRKYDWPRFMALVRKHQPDAMIFNMGSPTIRWVGNEHGTAPYPCWNVVEYDDDGQIPSRRIKGWLPAECDVPIRKRHWFWHPDDEDSLLTLKQLLRIYVKSVGHGTNLLLNVAPDNRGLLPEVDVCRVLEFGDEIQRRYSKPLAVISGHGKLLVIELPSSTEIDCIILAEDIAQGERVYQYVVEGSDGGAWFEIIRGTAIGHMKIDMLDIPVRVRHIRWMCLKAAKVPQIKTFALFEKNRKEKKSKEWPSFKSAMQIMTIIKWTIALLACFALYLYKYQDWR